MYLKNTIKMKKTRIKVRAYSCEFDIEVTKKEYLNVERANEYIKKEIVDTGSVISVTYLTEKGEVTFNSRIYKDPNNFINKLQNTKTKYHEGKGEKD